MPKEIKEVKLPGADEPVVLASVVSVPKAPETIAPEPTMPAPTIKHHFIAGSIAAGIILAVILLIWITVKVVPAIFSGSTSFVATTLNSTFIPADNGSSSKPSTKDNSNGSVSSANNNASVVQNYYGNPDLEVSLIATGIIDRATRQFVATDFAGGNDEVAVKFQVRNIGTNVSGSWTLRLNMPSRTTPYYDSNQPSIKPGDRIEFVGSFDSPTNVGINTGYIIADPFNAVTESSEANNSLTVSFNVNGTSYNYNNNYNYGTYNTNYNYNNGYYNTYPNYGYGQLYTWTNITVNCYANPQTAMRGTPITWYATASGGNGYFTYYWVGDDNLYGTNNALGHVYFTQGDKYATVSVTSGGQTVTRQCSTTIY